MRWINLDLRKKCSEQTLGEVLDRISRLSQRHQLCLDTNLENINLVKDP